MPHVWIWGLSHECPPEGTHETRRYGPQTRLENRLIVARGRGGVPGASGHDSENQDDKDPVHIVERVDTVRSLTLTRPQYDAQYGKP